MCEKMDAWILENSGLENAVFGLKVLSETETEFFEIKSASQYGGRDSVLCLLDPCHLSGHPSWILRNLLTSVAYHSDQKLIKVDPHRVKHSPLLP